MLRIMKPVGTERTFMHKLALFLLSSGLKWLFSIIANPAGLMNNLGCDWAVPDGWNEMPPLAFHQLGEAVIPTGWWCSLFWISVIFEEPTKYRWVTHSSCWGRILTDTPLYLFFPVALTQVAGRHYTQGRWAVGCLRASPTTSWGRMEPQASQRQLGAEGDCEMSNLLVPSPQSEAVTHEMEELSLQPTQSLPPLSERKNGEDTLLPHNLHSSSLLASHTSCLCCSTNWVTLFKKQWKMEKSDMCKSLFLCYSLRC